MTDQTLVNPHRSVTLDYLEGLKLGVPTADIACVDCPAGVWHRSREARLVCFCTVLHRDTWTDRLDPILHCDGREAAIAKIVRDQDASQPR